ncbi:hypothetical protein SCHPADRAFT_972337 [Schizopora paradoxa]|uniref:MYND-type domain-containing protein n=1 Tax=Schizopora paradoxa TaxID=27342 RepID=A0A0H2RKF6_9AGAM|nr:hypothetical protein SCHPADRAFT_972337 [Schizopora paradoxa]
MQSSSGSPLTAERVSFTDVTTAIQTFQANPRSSIRWAKAKSHRHIRAVSLAVQGGVCSASLLPLALDAFAHILESTRGRWATYVGRVAVYACICGLLGMKDDFYCDHPALRRRALSLWPIIWDWIRYISSEEDPVSEALPEDYLEMEEPVICRAYAYFVGRRLSEPDFARVDLATPCAAPEEDLCLLTGIWLRSDSRREFRNTNEVERLEFERSILTAMHASSDLLEKRRLSQGGPFNSLWAIMHETALSLDMTTRDIIKLAARGLKRAMEIEGSSKVKLRLVYSSIQFLHSLSLAKYQRGEQETQIVNQCLIKERLVELTLDSISFTVNLLGPSNTTSEGFTPEEVDEGGRLLLSAFALLTNILTEEHGVSSMRKALRHSPGLIQIMASVSLPSYRFPKLVAFKSIPSLVRSLLNIALMKNIRFVSVLSSLHSAIVKCPGLKGYCEGVRTLMQNSETRGLWAEDEETSTAYCWAHLYNEAEHHYAAFERLSEKRKQDIVPCSNIDCDMKSTRSEFQICAGCESVYYCSPACQKIAWREHAHKVECNRLRVLHKEFLDMTGLSVRDTRYLAYFAQESMRTGFNKALMTFLTSNSPPSPFSPKKPRKTPMEKLYPGLPEEDYTRRFNVALEVNFGLRETVTKGGFHVSHERISFASLSETMASSSPVPLNPDSEPETTFASAFLRSWGIPLSSQRPPQIFPNVKIVPIDKHLPINERTRQETLYACLTVVNHGKGSVGVHMPVLISDPSPLRPPPTFCETTGTTEPMQPYTFPLKVVYHVGRAQHFFYVSGASMTVDEYGGKVCGCCQICGLTEKEDNTPARPVHVHPFCAIHEKLFIQSIGGIGGTR